MTTIITTEKTAELLRKVLFAYVAVCNGDEPEVTAGDALAALDALPALLDAVEERDRLRDELDLAGTCVCDEHGACQSHAELIGPLIARLKVKP